MNLITTAAVMAAMLTGPFMDRSLTEPDESLTPRIAQAEREVTPAPLLSTDGSSQRIAAFWILLPN